jgi:2-C-methyl-D-erythritol 4-phosphate cytidylyltransferase/2-C-methyl-D-erythritol 2,4-cyclodiphosphate synthase
VVIPAAGIGRRFGDEVPKQYLPLAGRSVIEHAIAPFLADRKCAGVVVALAAGDVRFTSLPVAADVRVHRVTGGAERRDSVLAGLEWLNSTVRADPWVLVHDAARPCVREEDVARLLQAVQRHEDGALLAVRLSDTVKRSDAEGRVEKTVARDALWRAQTPQAFRLSRLLAAVRCSVSVTDESSAMEAVGAKPALVVGSPENIKITEPQDLVLAERLLAGKGVSMPRQRIGSGVDVHAFGPGDHVWLGGVRIAHGQGVIAHSDGDVILHALCDALLGAVGLGDIGQHFPDSDPQWKNAPSSLFVKHVLGLVAERGFTVVNADVTLLCEAPRIAAHRQSICASLAALLAVPVDCVNLKATTTERLGYLGRREGLCAEAVVLLESVS